MEINGNSRNIQETPASHHSERDIAASRLTAPLTFLRSIFESTSVTEAPPLRALVTNDSADLTQDGTILKLAAITAIGKGYKKILIKMLRTMNLKTQKAFFEHRGSDGSTIITVAAIRENPEILNILLETIPRNIRSALLSAENYQGQTALMLAKTATHTRLLLAAANEAGCVKRLIEIRDFDGRTALFWAIYKAQGQWGENGLGIDLEGDIHGYDTNESLNQIKMLIDAGASPLTRCFDSTTLLTYAFEQKNLDVVRLLLYTMSAEVQAELFKTRESDGQTILNTALALKTPEFTHLLLAMAKKLDCDKELLDARDRHGQTALFHAMYKAESGQKCDDMQILLDAGANLLTQDFEGKTALMHAVASNSPYAVGMIETLLKRMTPKDRMFFLNMRDTSGLSAFMHAMSARNSKVLITLFDAIPPRYRSDFLLTHRDPSERTLLMLAQTAEDMAVLLDIASNIKRDFDLLNARNSNNETALFDAVRRGKHNEQASIGQIQLLLSKGMSPIHMNFDGISAFMLAIEQGQWNIVFALIIGARSKQGLLFTSRDRQGRSAFMYAIEKKQLAIIEEFFEMDQKLLIDQFSYMDLKGNTLLDYAKKDPIIYARIKPIATRFFL